MRATVLQTVIFMALVGVIQSTTAQTVRWEDTNITPSWFLLKDGEPRKLVVKDNTTGTITVMNGPYSSTQLCEIPQPSSYPLTLSVESFVIDYNGDGKNDLVLSFISSISVTGCAYYNFEIVDVTTGQTLFMIHDTTSVISLDQVADLDNDGTLEMVVYKYDGEVHYLVYPTNSPVPSSVCTSSGEVHSLQLRQNYPNPFNPSTTISYQIQSAEHVTITIYDLTGRKVHVVANHQEQAGSHNVVWDGKDASGKRVASGVYFYQVRSGDVVQAKKMMLVR